MQIEKDNQLADAILRNDNREVLNCLYAKSFPKIKTMITRFGGTSDDAKDVFQDGVIVLYRKIKTGDFEPNGNPEGFLYTMCRNLWLNKMKRDSKMAHPTKLPDLEDENANVLQHFQLKEKEDQIKGIFEKLGDRCAKLLKMTYLLHYNTEEIAKEMELSSTDVVKTTKSRCKSKLMELLEEQPHLRTILKN